MQSLRKNYTATIYCSFTGYVVQAIINNFIPLLFLTFQREYQISLDRISLLITFNFGVQLLVDLLAAGVVDRIGYRACIVAAHLFAAAGLLLLPVLPEAMGNPFVGILIAVMIYAVGGGLIEVLISPIVEACPTQKKSAAMSLLHSFYCWGHAGVIVLSTVFFSLAGIGNWKILSCVWAIVPVVNMILFLFVPINQLNEEAEGMTIPQLIRSKTFWIMMLLMFCAGSCEQGISQWASAFAESGLGVSKTFGDLAGPCAFALLMGLSRAFYAKFSDRIHLVKFMACSGVLCLISYLLASLSPSPLFGLIGCALCGFSVGVLWPGTFSIASAAIRGGGTAMFAFLALAGDVGCSGGPTYVGFVANAAGGSLKTGILAGTVLPVLLLIGLALCASQNRKQGVEVR
ncbi:MAG: MFS transporter [Eubacteriales bacterium]|nr:MFS transporter [Eubacteriales bacterium]